MKNKQHELSKSKKTLDFMKQNGKKMVVWSLRPDQVIFLSRFYCVSPVLYTMKTKTFSNIRGIHNKLLKDLHYGNKRGKQFITRPLTDDDMDLLERNGVYFRPVKYKIVLN